MSLPRKTDRQMPVGLDARESYIFGKRMASGEWTNISTIRCFSEQRIAEANAVTAADLPKRPRVFYAISYIQPNSLALALAAFQARPRNCGKLILRFSFCTLRA